MPLRADRLIQRGVDQDTFGRHDHRRLTVELVELIGITGHADRERP
jgi:hypothetical protein